MARPITAGTGMIQWSDAPVYLHRLPVNFRKSINGLSVIVQESMVLDVFSGALFVFCRGRRDKVKILYWDKTGFCLWYKRLEKDKFKWPRAGDSVLNVSHEQFDWLLRGLDIAKLTPHPARYFSTLT